jgi:two-component system chemotaxis sensor kinase CheA
MDLSLDISQDEMPLFLAETEDHLQTLEEGLVRLEQNDSDPELIQALFRAAHTLKGMAGMIGHKRLVELTHALETGFDGIRKHNIEISTQFIDLCLESVDALRILREEVIDRQMSDVDVPTMAANINQFIEASLREHSINTLTEHLADAAPAPVQEKPAVETAKPDANKPAKKKAGKQAEKSAESKNITILAEISPNSIASAARAFQVMLALQMAGQIVEMQPSQEVIETSKPVSMVRAVFIPSKSLDDLKKDLSSISEIDKITIGEETIDFTAPKPAAPAAPAAAAPAPASPELREPARIGDYLVEANFITQQQLDNALFQQKEIRAKGGEAPMLGRMLIQTGAITQENLDLAITKNIQEQKAVLQTIASSEAEKLKGRGVEKTVRTSVERLDTLMTLVGELITDRNRLYQLRNALEGKYKNNDQIAMLSDTVVHVGRITDQLQEEVMHIRMLPIANVFNKFPRMVRDLAQKTGKELDLVIKGQDTELDRSVIEEINDPLIHLLRNSVDHGLETPAERIAAGKPPKGTVTLSARQEQGRIILTVEDDGKGIDRGKLKANAVQKGLITEAEAAVLSDEKAIDLIFISGVSTAKTVSDISGRGVGMDIVRHNVERLNGTITVETTPGQGSIFQISMPLTLAIVPTLLVKVNGITFAIPLVMVTETQHLLEKNVYSVNGRPVTKLRDQILTLVSLADIFDLEKNSGQNNATYMVVVRSSKMQIGLMVDALMGEEEVVVKSLGTLVDNVLGISSAAILGDGTVALILDVPGLFKLSGIH